MSGGDASAAARVLLRHGAEGGAVDKAGATAMDLAVDHDCCLVLQVFTSPP